MSRQLFTVGYEGRDINTFLHNLRSNGIDCVLDIRQHPLSRKPGFSKSQLARRLDRLRIQYVHLPDLGTPKPLREHLKSTGNYSIFFRKMDNHLANKKGALETAYSYVTNHTCCLMCFERLAAACHRKLVARRIEVRDGNGLQIKHL